MDDGSWMEILKEKKKPEMITFKWDWDESALKAIKWLWNKIFKKGDK